jgi:hypothetical protein
VQVRTLLYCRNEEDARGNFLFFDTIRTGFPDATISVYGNRNDEHFDQAACEKAAEIGASYITLDKEIEHASLINASILHPNEPLYVIDPDTIWFEPMPAAFDAAMAGRFIPNFYDVYSQTNTHKRLHTSVLYLDPPRIRKALEGATRFYFEPVFECTYYLDGALYRFDTLSKLYNFLSDDCHSFTEEENLKFAHIFCGTHISLVKDFIPLLMDTHNLALTDHEFARSLYPLQNDFFISSPWQVGEQQQRNQGGMCRTAS